MLLALMTMVIVVPSSLITGCGPFGSGW